MLCVGGSHLPDLLGANFFEGSWSRMDTSTMRSDPSGFGDDDLEVAMPTGIDWCEDYRNRTSPSPSPCRLEDQPKRMPSGQLIPRDRCSASDVRQMSGSLTVDQPFRALLVPPPAGEQTEGSSSFSSSFAL